MRSSSVPFSLSIMTEPSGTCVSDSEAEAMLKRVMMPRNVINTPATMMPVTVAKVNFKKSFIAVSCFFRVCPLGKQR